jgi:hypothetical protein
MSNLIVKKYLEIRRGQHRFEIILKVDAIQKAPMHHGGYMGGGFGYLDLFVQGNPSEAQQDIDIAHDAIRMTADEGVRGWVVNIS